MLLRMYARWAEQHGYKVEWLEESPGEEAGLKSATIQVKGDERLWLAEDRERRAPPGAHLALSTASARRHTSFASVWVYPVVDDTIEVEINRQGPARRHLPRFGRRRPARQQDRQRDPHHAYPDRASSCSCQADRSQHRNRATAMAMLRARLYEAELQKREAAAPSAEATKTDIGWGHQIRSYVLQPYQMVKDLRTGVETSDTAGRARRRSRPVHGRLPGRQGRRGRSRQGLRPLRVIPANAGIQGNRQTAEHEALDSRFRGNDDQKIGSIRSGAALV